MNTKDTSKQHNFYLLEQEDTVIGSEDMEENVWFRKLSGLPIGGKTTKPKKRKPPLIKGKRFPLVVSGPQRRALLGGNNG